MDTQHYLDSINAPGVNVLSVEWQTDVQPAAAYRQHTLQKVSSALVQTGVSYADLAVNSESETGDLPWGEWAMFPYVVAHKGNEYARLYTVDNTVRTIYLVDGKVVDRDTFGAYLTPSQRNASRPNGGTITVKMSGIRSVGAPSLVPV